jgi:hypothetical protein
VPYAQGDLKTCSACRQELPLDRFGKNRAAKDGLANQCRDCMKESRRKWQESNPELHRSRHIKGRYGISLRQYLAIIEATGGKCPVCGQPPTPPHGTFDLDHDHESGRVRGPLCRGCNLALGGARDDPAILRALADYVERHRANPVEFELPPDLPRHYLKGESHKMARLTEMQVREIRVLSEEGVSQSEIGRRFGVTQANISLIVTGRSWAEGT